MRENILLRMLNISKSFASNKVLVDLSLEVNAGEVVALLGENGAGKSTLIKILGGIYRADSGEIFINGERKSIPSAAVAGANGIRIIHQEIILVPDRTVAANVFLGREYTNRLGLIDRKRMERETQALLDEFRIGIRADQNVRELSIGMQQQVEIIKAISADARIVVMDEPTSSLSQREVDELFKIIGILKGKGIGIIYISHRLEELFAITDRILVLRDGHLAGNVPTSEAKKDELINLMVGRSLSNYYTRNERPTGEVALEVRGLGHERFFKDVSFRARYGEIVGFAGLVGARRTELMKTIFGAYRKSGGQILLDGREVRIHRPADAIREGIAYVSEDRRSEGLVLLNSVEFNMGLVCLKDFVRGIRVDRAAWHRMMENYRQKFSIKISSFKQRAGTLSGGNQQKVVLSKWLALKPKVIILDEPTRGIDVGSKAEIYEIIDQLASQGVSIIMVSSELPEIINMFDIRKKRWSEELLAPTGVRIEQLSRPVEAGTVIGGILPEMAERLKLNPAMQLVAGGHDQSCAALGSGLYDTRGCEISMGTCEFMLLMLPRLRATPYMIENHFACIPYVLPDTYLTSLEVTTCGILKNWGRRTLFSLESRECDTRGDNFYAELDGRLKGLSTTVLALPQFGSSGNPDLSMDAQGTIAGLTVHTRPEEIYLALIEGMSFQLYLAYERLKPLGVKPEYIVATGGGASSDVALQQRADVFGMRVIRPESEEAGTLGCMLLAATGTGAYPSLKDGIESAVRYKRVFEPDSERRAYYADKYMKYRDLYGRMRDFK